MTNKKMVGIVSLYSNYPVGIMRFGDLITHALAIVYASSSTSRNPLFCAREISAKMGKSTVNLWHRGVTVVHVDMVHLPAVYSLDLCILQ